MSEAAQPDREARLEGAIAEYLREAEAGQEPDREAFLARHPDLADDLRSFLADRDYLRRLAPPPEDSGATEPHGPTAADPGLGTVRYFGDYELVGELARGGFGVVYRARQVSLNRPVAVKMVLAGRLATPVEVDRFRREARTAANLDHPGVVPIFEVGEHEGQHYFSMKLIEGGDLGRRMGRFRGDYRACAGLVAAVARVVQHAHERGVLHRDLKPGNLLLDAQGRPHVTDFGLAKALQGPAGATQSGAVVGTPAYMAPEQAAGQGRELTAAADVYALGAILYELLTGRPPFQADTPVEVLLRVMRDEPEPPRKLCPAVPSDLETVCLKCLGKEPNRRYASAADLADDLEAWLEGRPIAARPAGRLERSWRWARKHPEKAAVRAIAFAALLGALIFAAVWGARKYEDARAERDRQRAEAHREAVARQREERDQAARRGREMCEKGQVAEGVLWLARALERGPAEDGPEGRRAHDEIVGWSRLLLGRPVLPHAEVEGLLLAPDGRTVWMTTLEPGRTQALAAMTGRPVVAPRSDRGKAWRIDPRSGRLVSYVPPEDGPLFGGLSEARPLRSVVLSPDGKLAATADGGEAVRLWDVATGKPVGQPMPCRGWAQSVQFSPNGRSLVAASGELFAAPGPPQHLQLWSTATQAALTKPLPCVATHGRAWWSFTPDGRALLRRDTPSGCEVIESDTGKAVGQCRVDRYKSMGWAVMAPHRPLLVADGARGAVAAWDLSAIKPRRVAFLRYPGKQTQVGFSPDGAILEVKNWDVEKAGKEGGADRAVNVTRRFLDTRDWSPVGKVLGPDEVGDTIRFHPSGRSVLSWDARARSYRLRDVRTGEVVTFQAPTAKDDSERFYFAQFSQNGETAVMVSRKNHYGLWETRTGKLKHGPFPLEGAGPVPLGPDWARFVAGGPGLLVQHPARRLWSLWDTSTGRKALERRAPWGRMPWAVYDPSGEFLRVGWDDEDLLVRAHDGTAVRLKDRPLSAGRKPVRGLVSLAAAPGPEPFFPYALRQRFPEPFGTFITPWSPAPARHFTADGYLVRSQGKALHLLSVRQGYPDIRDLPSGAIAVAGDGQRVLVREAGGILRWEDRTGKALRRMVNAVGEVHVLPSGGGILVTAGSDIALLDEQTFNRKWHFEGHENTEQPSLAHSGTTVAVYFPGREVWLLDARTGKVLRDGIRVRSPLSFLLPESPFGLSNGLGPVPPGSAFSSDGKCLLLEDVTAPAEEDRQARAAAQRPELAGKATLWDLKTGRQVGRPFHTPRLIDKVAFSPDGAYLAAACEDGRVWLWGVASRAPLGPPLPHRGRVFSLEFARDGKALWVGSGLLAPPGPLGMSPGLTAQDYRVWELFPSVPTGPEQARLWLEALTGRALRGDECLPLDDEAVEQRRKQLGDSAPPR
jgi:WD40 repeat protein